MLACLRMTANAGKAHTNATAHNANASQQDFLKSSHQTLLLPILRHL